jgi:hypothetical protein
MSTHSEKSIYDFEKLKGSENYVIWSMRTKQLLTRDKVWDIVVEKRTRPTDPEVNHAQPGSSPNTASMEDPVAARIYGEQGKWDEGAASLRATLSVRFQIRLSPPSKKNLPRSCGRR